MCLDLLFRWRHGNADIASKEVCKGRVVMGLYEVEANVQLALEKVEQQHATN